MAQFELDDNIFEGGGEVIVRKRLSGFGRFFQFVIRETSTNPFEIIGYVLYTVPAGTERGTNTDEFGVSN